MEKKPPATTVNSVSLATRDWALLKAIGEELQARGEGRATTSAAIRHLLHYYFESQPWRIAYGRSADAPAWAEFQTGVTREGLLKLRRVNLENGDTDTAERKGPFGPPPKRKR